jgi:competence protein ComEC
VNKNAYVYWTDDAVTINGYSLVLKITFGTHTFLFGGDLNTKSETYLMQKHAPLNPFEVDVAKSCHYGSSDFTEVFMQLVNPFATVIFSGDNESFSHPVQTQLVVPADTPKAKKGRWCILPNWPLCRPENKGNTFGMINCRCNGSNIFISQMKEGSASEDLWDSYPVGLI